MFSLLQSVLPAFARDVPEHVSVDVLRDGYPPRAHLRQQRVRGGGVALRPEGVLDEHSERVPGSHGGHRRARAVRRTLFRHVVRQASYRGGRAFVVIAQRRARV